VIEESKDRDLQAALDAYEELRRELPRLRIGLVHGRLGPAEKAAVMRSFAEGATQLLVCTTVIEVGVDVPSASLMVIEHAERFGLAQLHQLRGRIGRGARASHCVLLFQEPLSEAARSRLKVIYENADGFAVAEQDLLLRGPGELLGVAQSGAPLLRFADLVADEPLLEVARAAADELLAADEALARRHIDRWLGLRADFGKV
jgi:ATP-dependent DNA helicase RecG